ncbi:hypothetical protein GOBAR_AA07543 [Gossypium barbadense]|uniref:SWIM-type domain-containing protein n=1 Tax=Gossypium barbadense TaxID=3634 RepID=A0A2P5YC27_GOSBA|nr:hypothetical protein GOBAR_AA07543 [Gossypium barbadense]
MELVNDEDVETMVALYCGTRRNQNASIQLFAELAGMEATEDPTPLGEEDGAQESCMMVPISYVDSQSTIHGIDIDLNAAPETDVVGDDVYHSSDPSYHKVDSESDPDVDEVPDDIDDEGVNNGGNLNASLVKNQIHHIVIHNNLGAHMSQIDPDAAHAAEFSEYPEILPAHWMAVYSDPEELFYRVSYRKAWIAKQMAMEQLYGDFDASYNELQGWITAMKERSGVPWRSIYCIRHIAANFQQDYKNANWKRQVVRMVNQMEAGHVFVEDVKDAIAANRRMARSMIVEVYSRHNETFRVIETIGHRPGIPPRSYRVDLRNRRCDCRRFQTLHYPCAHVVAAYAKVSLNAEQFIDEVYTLERMLRVCENEFLVLPDLSTWEVPPMTFELVPDKGLRRNPKGRLQSSRIHNEMDIREKSDGKLCGVCRLAGHNQSKCPLRNYHVGQSSQSGRN